MSTNTEVSVFEVTHVAVQKRVFVQEKFSILEITVRQADGGTLTLKAFDGKEPILLKFHPDKEI